MISIVAAIDEKRGLGKNNDLLFKIPADHKRVKELTTGHPVIMGRRTFDSIGRVLPNRTNIIVTRDTDYQGLEGTIIAHSLEEAISLAKKSPGSDNIIIFGGGQIFKQALEKNLVDRLYLTVVTGDYKADTFFPDYSEYSTIVEQSSYESDGYHFRFLTLEKSP